MKLAWRWHGYLALLTSCLALQAQGGPAAKASSQTGRPIGVVVAIDPTAKRITLKTDAGPEMGIEFQDTTRILRVVPGSQDLSGAARVTISDVAAGDRILVRGRSGSEANSFLADTIILMSGVDLSKKQAADRADWVKRGIGGVITALDSTSRVATIRVGDQKSSKTVVLELPSGVKLRRYSPDSIRFSDARASGFEELKIGDQVKARGTSSQDGARFRVEELVSGTFRDFAATVVAVDVERGTVQVMELAAKLRVEARVLPASLLRRLSPGVVQILAARISGMGRSGGSEEVGNDRDLQTMIEALPSLTLAQIKAGDALVISGTIGDDPAKLTAITVLAGVEALLKASSRGARGPDIGSWNLDLNMGVGIP
jgi:hypothetical protein